MVLIEFDLRGVSARRSTATPLDADSRAYPGDEWVFDTHDDEEEPMWGAGSRSLWAVGEPLYICALTGAGKTTLAQRLVIALAGVGPPELLGLPVRRLEDGKVALYLAMDRPRQARRSIRRMVIEHEDRAALKAHVIGRDGPLPPVASPGRDPLALANYIEETFGGAVVVVVIDSLKDLAIGLNEDDVGASVNLALQELCQRGIEPIVLHHLRKPQKGSSARPGDINDLYGSAWLGAGAGSVLLLDRPPGSELASLRQLKAPEYEVGPLTVRLGLDGGTVTLEDAPPPGSPAETAAAAEALVMDYVRGNPGVSKSGVVAGLKGKGAGTGTVEAAIEQLLRRGALDNRGSGNHWELHAADAGGGE